MVSASVFHGPKKLLDETRLGEIARLFEHEPFILLFSSTILYKWFLLTNTVQMKEQFFKTETTVFCRNKHQRKGEWSTQRF